MDRVARRLVGALAGLGCQEEAVALTRHPRSETQLGVAVAGSCIDVVDAVLDHELEGAVGHVLGNARERRRAEDRLRAVVPRAAERLCGDHRNVSLMYIYIYISRKSAGGRTSTECRRGRGR